MPNSYPYTDVVELCALLQCLGFSVKSLDSSDGNMSQDGGSRTVVINCQTSGLHVVLESASLSCSCPVQNEQNSGVWQVSGVAGGKQLDKEYGCTLLRSLPKGHRERLTRELQEMIRCIKGQNENESDAEKLVKENKSASMTDLKSPEKLLSVIQSETPTRYRSLDTLTGSKSEQIPAPGPLQRTRVDSDCDGREHKKRNMCRRQSTYTLSSTPGSARHRNKTSSPIYIPQSSMLESLIAAEKAAEDLHSRLASVIREFMDEAKNDSSMSSLALDVSKISVLKVAETSKGQFASSPNLSGVATPDELTKSRLKRFDSASTSNLAPKSAAKEGKMSRLRRLSPNIFKRKENPSIKVDKANSQESRSKLNSLFKPKIITPVRVPKPGSEASPNLSTSSKKKFSHIKSTIPRPAKKD